MNLTLKYITVLVLQILAAVDGLLTQFTVRGEVDASRLYVSLGVEEIKAGPCEPEFYETIITAAPILVVIFGLANFFILRKIGKSFKKSLLISFVVTIILLIVSGILPIQVIERGLATRGCI